MAREWVVVGLLVAALSAGCQRVPGQEGAVASGNPTNTVPAAAASAAATHAGTRPARASTHAEAEQWQLAMASARRQYLQRLWQSGDVNDRLAATLLSGDEGGSPYERLAQLLREHPDNALAAWHLTKYCALAASSCDSAATQATLQRLDPHNTATWLLAMDGAVMRDDMAAAAEYLTLAAQASHHDNHREETVSMLWQAVRDLPIPPRSQAVAEAQRQQLELKRPPSDDDVRVLNVAAVAAALPAPYYAPLARLCWGNPRIDTATSGDCRAVLTQLASASDMLDRGFALGGIVQMTAGTPANTAWREQYRQFLWLRTEGYARVGQDLAFVRSTWAQGEVGALQSLLAREGLTQAPPDWLPRAPGERALVITGHRMPGH